MDRRAEVLSATIRIVLHGRLRRRFGPEYHLGVSTPAAALQALIVLVPGFRAELELGEYRVRRGRFKAGTDLPSNGLGMRIVPGGEMHIIPVATGRKNSGSGKVILGVVLVAASVVLAASTFGSSAIAESALVGGAEFGASFGAVGFGASLVGSYTIGNLALAGGALILGGIIQMISPQPKAANTAAATASYLLSGMNNVLTQGVPVPVVYGRTRVGSVVISLGYSAEEFSPDGALTTPAETGEGYAPTATGGTTPAGEETEAIGTSGPVDAGQGSTSESGSGGGGGKGGKGGGGGGGNHEDPDTLHSKATVRIIDVLGEGPIGGLVDGAKSIFFNDTPLQASDGSYNFKGVTWEVRYGLPDQDPVSGFPASESSASIATKVLHAGPVTRTIASSTATAARVTIRLPALFQRNTSTGDITAAPELNYKIEVKPSESGDPGWEGSWIQIIDVHIVGGKTMSPYQRSHRFNLPGKSEGANTWDIRLTRITADSTEETTLQNDLYFDLLDQIDDHQLIYPDTAYIALTFDAKAFGSSIPSRLYEIYGRTIQVPLNYDPAARTYATSGPGTTGGTWDLSSVHQLPSDNPAFVLLDMLSHTRYGCALKQRYIERVRAYLYNIAQYSDASVPNGFGGTEPRYTVNIVIANQDDAYRMIQYMVSAFRGMSYWGSGQVVVTADMPADPVKLVNQTNVLGGDFAYENTSRKTRHNLVRVAYLDKNNRYLPAYELVSDTPDIARRGAVPTDIVAWGCTSRGLAHRLGKWMIYTEARQTETVSYQAGPYHTDLRPSDKIKLSDPTYVGLRMAGRLRIATVSPWEDLHLDQVFVTDGSASYSISVVMPDGTIDDAVPIVSFALAGATPDYTIATLDRPLAMAPAPNAEWIITSTETSPRQFQVLALGEESKGVFSVTGVSYDPNKFAEVELGVQFDAPNYSQLVPLLSEAMPPPTNVMGRDYMTGVGVTQTIRTTVSWTAPLDPKVASFQVMASAEGFFQTWAVAFATSYDIDGLPANRVYTFAVRSVGRDGRTSAWAVGEDTVTVDGKVDVPEAPGSLTALGGYRRVQLTWAAVTNRRDVIHYEVWRSAAGGLDPIEDGTFIGKSGGTAYIDAESDVLVPNSIWVYWVRGVALADTLVYGEFAGPVVAVTTLTDTVDVRDNAITDGASITIDEFEVLEDFPLAGGHAVVIELEVTVEEGERVYLWAKAVVMPIITGGGGPTQGEIGSE